jgi:hypothetical protein
VQDEIEALKDWLAGSAAATGIRATPLQTGTSGGEIDPYPASAEADRVRLRVCTRAWFAQTSEDKSVLRAGYGSMTRGEVVFGLGEYSNLIRLWRNVDAVKATEVEALRSEAAARLSSAVAAWKFAYLAETRAAKEAEALRQDAIFAAVMSTGAK